MKIILSLSARSVQDPVAADLKVRLAKFKPLVKEYLTSLKNRFVIKGYNPTGGRVSFNLTPNKQLHLQASYVLKTGGSAYVVHVLFHLKPDATKLSDAKFQAYLDCVSKNLDKCLVRSEFTLNSQLAKLVSDEVDKAQVSLPTAPGVRTSPQVRGIDAQKAAKKKIEDSLKKYLEDLKARFENAGMPLKSLAGQSSIKIELFNGGFGFPNLTATYGFSANGAKYALSLTLLCKDALEKSTMFQFVLTDRATGGDEIAKTICKKYVTPAALVQKVVAALKSLSS